MSEPLNKNNISVIIILILLCVVGVITFLYVFDGGNHKKEIKELQDKNSKIEEQKKKLQSEFESIMDSVSADSIKIVKLNQELFEINKKLIKKENDLKESEKELKDMKDTYNKSKKEIEKIKETPYRRSGDELLKSIKEKTK